MYFELQLCPDVCPGEGLLDHSFLRKLHNVSHSGYTNLRPYQRRRIPYETSVFTFCIYVSFPLLWFPIVCCINH